MVARPLAGDAPFFDEWSRLHRVTRRSVPRASLLASALGVPLAELPALVVVGSKGKATAAIHASAALAGAGLRVGTITSPPVITNRERIRLDGVAIDSHAYDELSGRVADALRTLPPASAETGYVSPAGAYMIAGLDFLRRAGCDVFVVEAGMGGRSDEVSLLEPRVVAVTPVFGEHLGILGDDVQAIAREKLGAIKAATRAVVSAPQTGEVAAVFEAEGIAATFLPRDRSGALHLANAEAGFRAACAFAEPSASRAEAMRGAMATVSLPGRLTMHTDRHGRRWLADAAVDAAGVAFAVEHARRIFGDAVRVLVSLPDGKDIARTVRWLDAAVGAARWRPVVPPAAEHLSYTSERWGRVLLRWEAAEPFLGAATDVVAAGSWSFMSAVLAMLDAECERAFSVR